MRRLFHFQSLEVKVTKLPPEAFDTVLERIMGGESLRAICKTKGLPSTTLFLRQVSQDEELAKRYTEAMEIRANFHAEEIVRIADDCKDPQKARVQIDARKWILAKLLPQKYGEKLDLNHSGNVRVTSVTETIVDPKAEA